MNTTRTIQAAERLAALLNLAREHDDVNYVEVDLHLAASHHRLARRETPQLARPPRPQCDSRRRS